MALTDEQIRTIRKDWIDDYVDLHPEWGISPTVRVSASVGSATLSLTSLGVGTINRGTPFDHLGAGIRRDTYTVMESVAIAAGNAVVSIQPLLATAATAGETVKPQPIYKSAYNRQNSKGIALLFSDADIQDMADEADRRWTRNISGANDIERRLLEGIELLAIDRKLRSGSGFRQALKADDQRNTFQLEIADLNARAKELHAILDTDQKGPRFGRLFR